METILIYAIIMAAIFGGLVLINVWTTIARLWQNRLVSLLYRFLIYPTLARRVPLLNSITPIRGFFLACYIAGTLFCNFWGISNPAEASLRAGWISVATMIPVFVTGRLSVAMNLLGLSLDEVRAIHGATGMMATSQTAAHIGIALRQIQFSLADRVQFYGFLAATGSALLVILLVTRRRAYFFFRRTHLLLALFICVSIWCHPRDTTKSMLQRPYLLVAIATYSAFIIVQSASIILRNFILRSRRARANLKQHGDGFHIELTSKAALDVFPGQFVYLWMPGLSFSSFFRTYPFMICWQEGDEDKHEANETPHHSQHTSVALVPIAHGIGKKFQRVNQLNHSILVWVDGPYGNPPNWGKFDEIVFVASGIGIAAQMLPIKYLVEARRNREIVTKSISLHWKVDNSLNAEWVNQYFNRLLELDADKSALSIDIYVPLGDKTTEYSAKRIQVLDSDEKSMKSRLCAELDGAKGNVLLSVCSDSTVRYDVQHLCTKRYYHHPTIKFHTSDFEVNSSGNWWWKMFSEKHI